MYSFLIVLIVLVSLVLATAVLLQAGQGGGLASLGGGPAENVVGGRQAETIRTKGTRCLAAAFMFLALFLSELSSNRGPTTSRTQELLQQQQQQQAPAEGSLPLGPAPTTTAPAPQPTAPAPNPQP